MCIDVDIALKQQSNNIIFRTNRENDKVQICTMFMYIKRKLLILFFVFVFDAFVELYLVMPERHD